MDLADRDGQPLGTISLTLAPFRRTIREYFAICDSYYKAIRNATPMQIETVDMARRGIHNDAAEQLRERLAATVAVDFDTADRKSVVEGKSVSVRVDIGGRRIIKKKKN